MTNKILLWPVLLLFVFLHPMIMKAQAPKTNYDVLWKKVDSLYSKKGLTKSALDEVNKIYALAKKENAQPQIIKALIYKSGLEQNLNDDGDIKNMQFWEKEIAQANVATTKALLNSIAADKYNRYFQNNRWKFYNRTTTVDFKKDDPSTWSIDDLQQRTSDLYLASIKDEKVLQQTKLDAYDPILVKGNARYLRPTLYDLLANRALEFFKTDERYVTKPAYNFEITQASAFDPAADFIHRKFETKDTASLLFKALMIYQKLIAFHINDQKPDALIDADIQRLQFVYTFSVILEKDTYYFNAINHVAHQYESYPAAAQAWYLVALWHTNKAAEYKPLKDTANRYENLKAKEICEKILQQKDSSEGRFNCRMLLQQIQSRLLTLQTEKVNIPGQPFRTLVSYKNMTKLHLRIVELSENMKAQLEDRYGNADSYWRQVVTLKTLKSWSQDLPDTKDYQLHNVEIKVDALPVGDYFLIASADEKFSLDKNPLALQRFYISSISYLDNKREYFVLDRESGKPLQNAQVQTWLVSYDYTTRKNVKVKGQLRNTDSKGYVKFEADSLERNKSRQVEIKYKDDHLFMDDQSYNYYRPETAMSTDTATFEKENRKVFLFSDRRIYRPGQTIYFKGIAITKDFVTKKSKIVPGEKTTVILFNANNEKIDSLELTSNEFGSYSGKFRLPEGGLNGRFSIADKKLIGELSFSVEEYKRPKFSVEFDTLTTAFRVNDSITIKGKAKAFAGNSIDGAQVAYRVTRNPRFIYPWAIRKADFGISSMEIINGVAITAADGSFTITFKAIPDESVRRELEPVFDYNVTADVTDINGETRSGKTTVSVGYKSTQIEIGLEEDAQLLIDSFKKVTVAAKNFNGGKTPAQVQLQIFKLQQQDRLIRKRYWEQPDQFVMSYDDYIRYFPNDEYKDESEKESWKKLEKVVDLTDSANKDIPLNYGKLTPGWYLVQAIAKDRNGDTVKDLKYVLLDDNSSKLPVKTYITAAVDDKSIQPGEMKTITIGSSANDVTLIKEIKRNTLVEKKQIEYSLVNLNNEKKRFDITAFEEDRGGISVTCFFVKNNRRYAFTNNVLVPWTNKELDINYETWRDKTLPGSEEKWKVKVSGPKKEKVAAEMLASMYDASLDEFTINSWDIPDIWPTLEQTIDWHSSGNFNRALSENREANDYDYSEFDKRYDELISIEERRRVMMMKSESVLSSRVQGDRAAVPAAAAAGSARELSNSNEVFDFRTKATLDSTQIQDVELQDIVGANAPENKSQVQLRKNFNETAFFFPDLKTDAEGNISFSFTMPEALTKWTFQALAHTKDLSFGYSTVDVVTQKELMIQPNAPRFLREGDKIELSAKVVNMSDKELTGTVQLELLNASTMQPVDGWFQNIQPLQYFTVSAGQSSPMKFSVNIPYGYNNAVVYRFKAVSGNVSDGEEMALPVVANSMLVTESMPLNLRNTNSKTFTFEKLLQSGKSETLQQHALTVEYTSNPAWYAVQALPYLTDFPYECAEQTFNRYYANALAGMIANKAPKLKAIVEKWNATDSSALLSNLQKNEELKSVLLEETPWVLEAKNEAQQKKNIALLFDMVRMNAGLQTTYDKLKQLQSENGGFVWFKGGPDDRYITQYIASSIGHLKKLGALQQTKQDWNAISKNAVAYLDKRITDDYNELVKRKVDLKKNNLSYIAIQYLYMRSFYSDIAIPGSAMNAISYYRKQAQQYWLQQGIYAKGMIALALNRTGDKANAAAIIKSLQQNATVNEEQGMYWKDVRSGYFWYEAPIETQSLMIEAFAEISNNAKTVNDLKTWLLKNKQTNNWKTTKATADACYALLLQGSDWLTETPNVTIKLGDKTISSTDNKSEAGTGYFKTTIDGAFVKPEMGNITVNVSGNANNSTSWGSVYWQYFERLENITPSATPLKLSKKLFVEKNTDRGPVLQPVNENDVLKVGDKIKVRIELRADRDMEYVHMKDMRASCMEPVNVISTYKWQDGLGYYESTKDASTNFFFDYIRKGTYVFEYPLFVTHEGNFSNGVTTIQCMYAPEFTSHSEGVRVNVE